MEGPIQDPDDPTYGMWPNPMEMTDKIQVTFHCHKPTLMEAMSACMQFIDQHDLETPDVNTNYASVDNPHNGKTLEWYEATVSAVLPDGAKIVVTNPPQETES